MYGGIAIDHFWDGRAAPRPSLGGTFSLLRGSPRPSLGGGASALDHLWEGRPHPLRGGLSSTISGRNDTGCVAGHGRTAVHGESRPGPCSPLSRIACLAPLFLVTRAGPRQMRTVGFPQGRLQGKACHMRIPVPCHVILMSCLLAPCLCCPSSFSARPLLHCPRMLCLSDVLTLVKRLRCA